MLLSPALALIFAALAPAADASDYPAKPIRIIAQFTAGSSTDILARIVAQKMAQDWNQQVIVDNRPGAGGVLGTELGAKANPDGYTLTMAVSSAFGINPTLYPNTSYNVLKDFAPISNLGLTPQTLVTNPAGPFKSVREFVGAAKEKPGQINYASLGNGSTSHLTMEMFRFAADIRINHVPFKGSAEAHTQLIGGQIPVMFDAIPATLPHIKSGRLRGLGIAYAQALAVSARPADHRGIRLRGIRSGRLDRHRGPRQNARCGLEQAQRRNGEDHQRARCEGAPRDACIHPVGDSRAQFTAFMKSEIAKWGKAVKDSGAKAE